MASLTKIFRLILTLTAGLWILTATDGALAKGGSGSGKQSSMSYNSSSRKSDHKDNDTDKHKDKYADKDKHKCKDSTCKDKDAGNTTGTGGITGKPPVNGDPSKPAPVATNPPGTPPPAAAPPGGDTVVRDHRPGGNAYDGPVEVRDHRKPPIVRDHRSGGGGGTVTKPAPMPVAGAGY